MTHCLSVNLMFRYAVVLQCVLCKTFRSVVVEVICGFEHVAASVVPCCVGI